MEWDAVKLINRINIFNELNKFFNFMKINDNYKFVFINYILCYIHLV